MSIHKKEKNDSNWIELLDRHQLIQSAKSFDKDCMDSVRCYKALSGINFYLGVENGFLDRDLSGIFFSVTKLFRNSNPSLRRLVYLTIQRIKHDPKTAFMAISSLIKDLTDLQSPYEFRANAIKALSVVADKNIFSEINRYLHQSILADNTFVQSAALAVGIRLLPKNRSLISKWAAEAGRFLLLCNAAS